MAINFSAASFAACLAGLKVPRQIMYCIAQDANTPYVFYKDGMERTDGWGNQATQTSPQQVSYQAQQQHSPVVAPIQNEGVSSTSSSPSCAAEPPTQTHTSTMTSPVPSPFVASTGTEEDGPADRHVGCDGRIEHRVCFPGQQPNMPAPQLQADNNGNAYYRPGPMLTPSTFMHYLKQPGSGMMLMGEPLADGGYNQILSEIRTPDGAEKSKNNNLDLRLFKCLTCGKDFKQKSTLLQHERIHTDSRPYPCGDCGKRFRQQSHLSQHFRIHSGEKPFSCPAPECGRTFRQRAILNQHLRIHSGEKPFSCPAPECGRTFRQKAIVIQHFRTHQDVSPHLLFKNGNSPTLWPQDVPFPDEGSPKNNADLTTEITHYPEYFKDGKGVAHPICSAAKLPGLPLFVKCPICQKEFKQKSTLLQHGCIHIESRPYPCGDCGKRFRQQSHLTQHLRIHKNEKPYACFYCGRHFRQRTILNQHVRIHTGEKPYRCLQCGKDFRQKAILDQHTRTHQGERPFCCPLPNCRRRFSTDHDVKKHVENHMNPLSKTRRQTVSPPIPTSSVPYIKPELYFPPAFTQFAAGPAITDFKPAAIEAQ